MIEHSSAARVTYTSLRMREELLAELKRHLPADLTERGHLQSILQLLHLEGDVGARHHYVPGHLTASAFIVDLERGLILLHHHRRLDRWLQMGGHLDPNESSREAALREAKEESGLRDLTWIEERIFDVDVHLIPAAKGEPEHRHFDIRYLVGASSEEPIAFDEAESLALRWFPLSEAEGAMNEEASSRVLRKIERKRAEEGHGAATPHPKQPE